MSLLASTRGCHRFPSMCTFHFASTGDAKRNVTAEMDIFLAFDSAMIPDPSATLSDCGSRHGVPIAVTPLQVKKVCNASIPLFGRLAVSTNPSLLNRGLLSASTHCIESQNLRTRLDSRLIDPKSGLLILSHL